MVATQRFSISNDPRRTYSTASISRYESADNSISKIVPTRYQFPCPEKNLKNLLKKDTNNFRSGCGRKLRMLRCLRRTNLRKKTGKRKVWETTRHCLVYTKAYRSRRGARSMALA